MNLSKAEIKNLRDKKYRKNNKLFMVEGDKFCYDLLNSNIEIVYTLTSNKNLNSFPNVCLVSPEQLSSIATTKTNQDIICVCKKKECKVNSLGNSLILDNLQDPGNVGTLVRSALAFGFKDVYLVEGADPYGEKVIRSSAGTMLKIRLHECSFEEISKNKKLIADNFIVADMNGENLDAFKKPAGKIAIIIGNEGQGVSDKFIGIADKTIAIKMSKQIESLNAGVAGSIIMEKFKEI